MLSDLNWSHHPAFGIVHPSGCNVCLSYMRHVADAIQLDTQDDSLRLAIKERDSQGSMQYLNGVSEGIRLQVQDIDVSAADILAKYRAERDEVLEMLNLRTAQLVAAEQELIQVKEKFKALQALLDDAALFPTSTDLPVYVESSASHSQGEQTAETTQEGHLRPMDTSPLPTPPPTPPITESASLSSWSAAQDMASHRAATPLDDNISDDLGHSSVLNAAPDEPVWDSMGVYSLEELTVLLSRARAGDEQASMIVDAMYTTAKSIPEADRKAYQQFIIFEWKPRSSTRAVSAILTGGDQPSTKHVKPSVPEIFVDSSGWGIGFVLNGRWLAWKLKPGWQAHGRDNNWTEMVAVELGVLVAVSAGFQSRTVIIRSDNTGVVKALQKGTSKHPRQPEVLKRIKALTRSRGINLEVRWVSSEHNPADRPSRGNLPPDALGFPATIHLPDKLLPFLSNST